MHLGMSALLKFFQAHRDDESLVLVSVTAKEGSSYRKPGALMLISQDKAYEGMISGGCLEGDLLHHAVEVFSSGEPRTVTYDMHAGDELVFSLGLGCDGVIHVLLQRLDRDSGFALLEFIQQSLQERSPVLLALVTASTRPDLPVGTAALLNRNGSRQGNNQIVTVCAAQCETAWPSWRQQIFSQPGHTLMIINIQPPPRVLLCGAGPDAVPAARLIAGLGWECVIVDHRPAFARAERFPPDCGVTLCRPEQLKQHVDLDEVDAVVIMSHNLNNDAAYLRQLTQNCETSALQYIGVLGSSARRDRLREMAQCPEQAIYGPAGLDIGAELPEAIALSILAEIHATLNHRDGQSMTIGPIGGLA